MINDFDFPGPLLACYDEEIMIELPSDDLPDTAAPMNEGMAEDDAKDPYLESYQTAS